MTPIVSIIIPVYNEGQWIRATLENIVNVTTLPVEILVIDDGSTDKCTDFIPTYPTKPNIKLILVNRPHIGVAAARNNGALHATTNNLLFIDAHCAPNPGWLEAMLSALKPKTLVTACISCIQNSHKKGYGATPTSRPIWINHYEWLPQIDDKPHEVPLSGGGCMFIEASWFRKIGGFDTMAGFGIEDSEFSVRNWLAGGSIVVVPSVEIMHFFKQSTTGSWDDYTYNTLRAATMHLRANEYQAVITHLESKQHQSLEMAKVRLKNSDFSTRCTHWNSIKQHTIEWYYSRFQIK